MTVSSEVSQVSYATDGVTTAFPVPFYFLANDHLRVWLYYESTGVETDLVLGSSYDVVGAGDPSGGTVTTTVAYPVGPQLRIERIVPITQETAYQRNDPFPERAHERALDKLTMICQQLAGFFGLLPGSTLRALLLGRNDVDGQGSYRARNNRIQDLADPVANQDAVNRRSMFAFVTEYVDRAIAGVVGGFGWFLQSGMGAIYRTFQNKMRESISAADFGATGDGGAFDAELQSALNAASGKKLVIGPGLYKLVSTDALIVSSDTVVRLHPKAVIHQTQKGKKAAFAAMPGSSDISISGGTLIGPYYQGLPKWVGRQNSLLDNGDTWAGQLAENIGIDLRGRWYQREVLGYGYEQMLALTDEMRRISISDIEIYGFGQSAIIADNITGFYADKLHLHDCGRDGLRMYGVRRGCVTRPDVHDLLLGKDGAYPNWNVYGVTCTRVYGKAGYPDPDLRIGRPTEWVSVENFYIDNCATWKSLDTHGGRRLRFLNGVIRNSYIGIGVDSGGSGDAGVAPPIDVTISGVQFISDSNAKYKRAGIAAFASGANNDGRVGLGNGLNISNCTFDGYGGDNFDAALSISNFRNVNLGTSHFRDFTRAAVLMAEICEDVNIGAGVTMDGPRNYMTIAPTSGGSGYTSAPDVIISGGNGSRLEAVAYVNGGAVTSVDIIYLSNDWTVAPTVSFSGGGGSGAAATATIHSGRGVIVGSATCSGTMVGVTMRNSDPAQPTAVGVDIITAPSAGYGFKVSNDNNFFGYFAERVRNFRYEGGGTFQRVPIAQVRCTAAGVAVGGYGIASVTKPGTGEYVVTLSPNMATSANQINPEAAIYDSANTLVRARMDSATQITVRTTNLSAAFQDAPFTLTVWANQGSV